MTGTGRSLADDVLIAERLNGAPLDGDHGAPARLVSPHQYGFISTKHLCRIELHTSNPVENFGSASAIARMAFRSPLFWRHPRARVWGEERHPYLPAWVAQTHLPAAHPAHQAAQRTRQAPSGANLLSHRDDSIVNMSMDADWDVIVVGAGLAGLAAGATAAAGGASTLVLDAHQRGGRARTVEKGAYTFNMGPHALYVGGPGTAVLRSLGIEPDGVPSPFRCYRLLKDGEVHVVPSGPASLLRTTAMGRASKAQFARLLGLLPLLRPARLAGTSVRAWLQDHSLRPDAEAVVRTLIRLSTYTADVESFSADAAVRQLQIGARPGVQIGGLQLPMP